MIRFTYDDQITSSDYPNLDVSLSTSSLLKLYRILLGSIKVNDAYGDIAYDFDYNYFTDNENQTITVDLLTSIFPEEIDLSYLNNFFQMHHNNKKFYTNIKHELVNSIIAITNNNHLESFLFSYRILEGISYSLPLIYMSKAKEFEKTYKALQNFISAKDDDGELTYFKKFLKVTFNKEDILKQTIRLNFSELEYEELKPVFYKECIKLLKDKEISDSAEDEFIEIKYADYFSFMIRIRCRYFHYLQGTWQENIDTSTILFPNLFFKIVSKNSIKWIAMLFYELLYWEIEKLNISN